VLPDGTKCAAAGIATRTLDKLKGQVEEGDEEPICRKNTGRDGASADEAIWLEDMMAGAEAEEIIGHIGWAKRVRTRNPGHRGRGTRPDHRAEKP